MYSYNITSSLDPSIHESWMHWMTTKHIPEILSSGTFNKVVICQVLTDAAQGGLTYAVQYSTDSLEALERYQRAEAPKHQAAVQERFKDKALMFDSILKRVVEASTD
ncbi:MAG: DUF4286 family protein [Lutibacter sp.]|nr:DUF4286 family protein [Lutibacter sp.]